MFSQIQKHKLPHCCSLSILAFNLLFVRFLSCIGVRWPQVISQASLDLEVLLPQPHERFVRFLISASVSHFPLLVLRLLAWTADSSTVSSQTLPVGNAFSISFPRAHVLDVVLKSAVLSLCQQLLDPHAKAVPLTSALFHCCISEMRAVVRSQPPKSR